LIGLAELSLTEASAAVRLGEASARELLQACRVNLTQGNPVLNATIWLDLEQADRAAVAADAAWARDAPLRSLHGLSLAHKDMFRQHERTPSCGAAIPEFFSCGETATAIDRLANSGASVFAGLNMAEFAQNATGHNQTFGHCRNPWNPQHIPGGSSSGSAAAVAACFTYAALGSDTGGSIRIPASACGVTGLKPTLGRVSRAGAMPLSSSNDTVGPLARTARDCARVLSIIAGADPRDPASANRPVPDYEAALDGLAAGLRIAIPRTHFLDGVDAEVASVFEAALGALKARGATLHHVSIPAMPAVVAYSGIVSRVEAATIHCRWIRKSPQLYSPSIHARLYASLAIPAVCYVEALSCRGKLLRHFAEQVFAVADVLAVPTLRCRVPTLDETDLDVLAGGPGAKNAEAVTAELTANTRPINYLGLPAVSMPCGFDTRGLPIGLQLIGRPFAEAAILKLADAYQRETDWHLRRPSLTVAEDIAQLRQEEPGWEPMPNMAVIAAG